MDMQFNNDYHRSFVVMSAIIITTTRQQKQPCRVGWGVLLSQPTVKCEAFGLLQLSFY